MKIDYTKFFNTPDELAVFCMLEPEKQKQVLVQLTKEGNCLLAKSCQVKKDSPRN